MLLLTCPYCGPREEVEFRYGGEGVALPTEKADEAAWTRFLYYRSSPAGPLTERWVHTHGCRRWFYVVRDTTTHEISATGKLDETPGGQR